MMLKRQNDHSVGDGKPFEADLDRALMTAFCRALDVSGLSPAAVISAMAGSLGSVYRQVADAHQNQQCPCGWQPVPEQDMERLHAALKAAAVRPPADQLSTMLIQGRA